MYLNSTYFNQFSLHINSSVRHAFNDSAEGMENMARIALVLFHNAESAEQDKALGPAVFMSFLRQYGDEAQVQERLSLYNHIKLE